MSEQRDRRDFREVYVSWRDPGGSIHPVGRLGRSLHEDGSESYSFTYLKMAEILEGFEPLPGLPELHRRYTSTHLFPVFANRSMPRSRPEFDILARRVDLAGDADPFEVLARGGGRRATDRIEVFLAPERQPDGSGCALFFVRGIRHVPGAEEALCDLRRGERLELVPDAGNRFNARALIVSAASQQHLGYVPDYLVEFIHEVQALTDTPVEITVEHVNDGLAPSHMRLLCRVTAPWPEGYEPFSDAQFQPLV